MNKRGFIVSIKMLVTILLVTAAIAIPVIYIIGDNSKESAMREISNRVDEAAYRYFIKQMGATEAIVLDADKDINKIELSGQKPTGGTIVIETNGVIKFAIYNEYYCSIKKDESSGYEITEYEEGKCHL